MSVTNFNEYLKLYYLFSKKKPPHPSQLKKLVSISTTYTETDLISVLDLPDNITLPIL